MSNPLAINVGIARFDQEAGRFSFPGRSMVFYPDTTQEQQELLAQLLKAIKTVHEAHIAAHSPQHIQATSEQIRQRAQREARDWVERDSA